MLNGPHAGAVRQYIDIYIILMIWYRALSGMLRALVPDGGAATLPPGAGGGTGAPVAGLADDQPS